MSETDLAEVEVLARSLHARRCRLVGIHEPDRIADYWESCDQEMYRMMALDRMSQRVEQCSATQNATSPSSF